MLCPSLQEKRTVKILIVEDDPKCRSFLARGLSETGMSSRMAADGETALELLGNETFDIVLLDVTLPGIQGWEVLEKMRESGNDAPVIFLTARDAVDERVRGLRMGADDYVVKPFAFSELLARIHVVQRNRQRRAELRVADLHIDYLSGRVLRGEQPIDLTRTEFKLLRCLAEQRGKPTSKQLLLKSVWGFEFDPETNVVEVHIRRLRKKLDEPFEHPMIRTVRGEGYVLEPAEA